MRITYDPEADALGVWLHEDAVDAAGLRSVRVTADVRVDVDAAGRALSLEVLGASRFYPVAALRALASPAVWLTLAEAAQESGLTRETLKKQVQHGRLAGEKRGRDWFVTRAALWTYLDNRGPRGRRPASRKGRRLRRQMAGKP